MNTINFSNLPFLVQQRILELGDPALRFNLSCLSERMENVVRQSRTKTRDMLCAVKDKKLYIAVRGEERNIHVQFNGIQRKQKEGREKKQIVVNGKYMISRMTKFHPTVKTKGGSEVFSYYSQDIPASPRNSSAVMNWMIGLLRPLQLRWKFDVVSDEDVKSLVAFPQSQNARTVKIKGGELESESLSALIDHVKCADCFVIKCELPLDFHHDQPFRFPSTMYKEARWVKLEDLLPMSFCRLNLGETNIDSSHLNTFLKEWMAKDPETVRMLTISELKEKIAWKTVLCGVRSLYFTHEKKKTLLIASKTENNRAGQLGKINSDDQRQFQFIAVPDSQYPGKKELLQMMHLHDDLKAASELAETKLAKLEELEWDTEEGREQLREIRQVESMKAEIDRQLREVSRKLELEGVDFSQDMAIIQQPINL